MIRSRRRPIDVLACVLFASASYACGSGGNATVDARQSVETEVVVCDRAPDGRVTEYHVLPPINHKLASFPEFATEIGMTAATDCQSARDFEIAYQRYSEEHPGFDADEPAMPIPWMDVPPMDARPDLSVSKIQGGGPPGVLGAWPNQAVVRIGLDDGTLCSGTFIAKNWIATAAHCLDVLPSPTDLRPPEPFTNIPLVDGAMPALRLWGYAKWTIMWSDATGAIVKVIGQEGSVLQYPDPAFRGFVEHPDGDQVDEAHDFALLFLHPALFDLVLPPDPESGSAMAIGWREPAADGDEEWSAAGYSTGQLRTKEIPPSCDVQPCDPGEVIRVRETELISIQNGAASNEPRLCKSDSGGPLYRLIDVGVSPPLGVLDGVYSNVNSARSGTGCSPVGSSDRFRRVDKVKDYIQRAMRMWNGANFSCRVVANDYARCWGKSCTGAPDGTACFSDESCNGSGFQIDPIGLESCSQCPNGDCSCIRGQCLKFD